MVEVEGWALRDFRGEVCGLGTPRPRDVLTFPDGKYFMVWSLPGALGGDGTFNGCMSFRFTRPAESGLVPVSLDPLRMTFYDSEDPGLQTDTLVVDVVLPAADSR